MPHSQPLNAEHAIRWLRRAISAPGGDYWQGPSTALLIAANHAPGFRKQINAVRIKYRNGQPWREDAQELVHLIMEAAWEA